MRRRDFIAGLGWTAVARPGASRAQQPAKMPVIGYLSRGTPGAEVGLVAAFRKGLGEMGYVDGRNLAIEFRWAEKAHSTAKCNGEIFGVEENLTRSSVAEYLSGTRIEFVLHPLDIGIRHNREIGTFWEVLSE
jgi:hypothetical protein